LQCAAGDFFPDEEEGAALLLLLLLLAAGRWLLAAASASAWPARGRTKSATLCWQEVLACLAQDGSGQTPTNAKRQTPNALASCCLELGTLIE
jgi:hypothetical protein